VPAKDAKTTPPDSLMVMKVTAFSVLWALGKQQQQRLLTAKQEARKVLREATK
jgi:hypothetical protein